MPHRLTLLVGLLGVSMVVVACAGSNPGVAGVDPYPAEPAPSVQLSARSVFAGGVEVRAEPQFLDDQGASFALSFDTHEVDLAIDVARSSRLEVGGIAWDGATWVGDPPGGHHRQGELRFTAQGPAAGKVILRIEGLPDSVEVVWDLEEGR